MITSSIKTNLILKEIGVTRYSLRSNKEKTKDKEIHIYQKGNILTLLDIGFDDLPKDEAVLLKAIVGAINPNESNELIETIKFDSSSHVQEMIASKKTLAGVIAFSKENLEIQIPLPIIRSKTLGEIIRNPSLKKPLWENIKKDIIK
ncbi:DNA polymerase III subunit psi [Gammaproteobacteria bacterium]|nr:DNA polymerase III subunit psi [Gammaproteobacteria bacterium]